MANKKETLLKERQFLFNYMGSFQRAVYLYSKWKRTINTRKRTRAIRNSF